jgi:FkbM family methyltransferase
VESGPETAPAGDDPKFSRESRYDFFYKRYLEDPYHELVEWHGELFRGGNVLAVGANIGYTALVFSRAVDPGYKAYAFEPERFNYAHLERSSRARRPARESCQFCLPQAIGTAPSSCGKTEHHHGDHRTLTEQFRERAAPSRSVTTPILRIDTFIGKQRSEFPVRFIKVDVQGYEFPVCKGMERTLTGNPHAILALEYMPEAMRELGFHPEDLLIWLRQRDYQAHALEKHGRFDQASLIFQEGRDTLISCSCAKSSAHKPKAWRLR